MNTATPYARNENISLAVYHLIEQVNENRQNAGALIFFVLHGTPLIGRFCPGSVSDVAQQVLDS